MKIWLWFEIMGWFFLHSVHTFFLIQKEMGSDCVLSGLCYLGQRIRSKHSNIFPKWNYWQADAEQLDIWMLLTSKYLTLSPEKKGSLAAVEFLCSVCQGRWLYFQDRPEKKVNILHFWYAEEQITYSTNSVLFMLFLFCIVKQALKLTLFCFKNPTDWKQK